jgi:hypothetical protein
VIGRAEDLLWPGARPKPQVAILHPRSSQVWDLKEMAVAEGISDATNTDLTGRTVDHMAEVFGIYLALQHANVPADVVDEDDLSADGLKDYRVLYVTAPNVPAEGQRAVADWVRGGNTLVTTVGAAQRGRYDDPCTVLADATGLREQPRRPTVVPNLAALKAAGAGNRGGWSAR